MPSTPPRRLRPDRKGESHALATHVMPRCGRGDAVRIGQAGKRMFATSITTR